jgi:hypothetical protein
LFIGNLEKEAARNDIFISFLPPIEGNSVTVILEMDDPADQNIVGNIITSWSHLRKPTLIASQILIPNDEPNVNGAIEYDIIWGNSEYSPPDKVDIIVDTHPTLPNAVFCIGITKKLASCRNKTRDESKMCWRHRNNKLL